MENLKKYKSLPPFLAPNTISLLASIMQGVIISEVFGSGESSAIAITSIALFPVNLLIINFVWVRDNYANSGTSSDLLKIRLNELRSQSYVYLATSMALGAIAPFMTAQAIETARNRIDQNYNSPSSKHYENLLSQREEYIKKISSNEISDYARKSLLESVEIINQVIPTIVEDKNAEANTAVEISKQHIDGRFLFDFFSTLLVRVGSIAITLILFYVSLKEFRIVNSNYALYRNMQLAHMLDKEKRSPEKISKLLEIIPVQTRSELDIAKSDDFLANSVTDQLGKILQPVLERLPSAKGKESGS